jgi:hypothetical protein
MRYSNVCSYVEDTGLAVGLLCPAARNELLRYRYDTIQSGTHADDEDDLCLWFVPVVGLTRTTRCDE